VRIMCVCSPTDATLAGITGYCRRSLYNARAELLKTGFIEVYAQLMTRAG